jgi:hypothetical protein
MLNCCFVVVIVKQLAHQVRIISYMPHLSVTPGLVCEVWPTSYTWSKFEPPQVGPQREVIGGWGENTYIRGRSIWPMLFLPGLLCYLLGHKKYHLIP